MPETVVVGIENASRESGTTVRENYSTVTPSQQTGYPAINLLDERGVPSRAATADVAYTTHLIRFAEPRKVGAGEILAHNISASGQVRVTADKEATRPAWSADGIDDSAATAETIPASTDITLFWRGYLPSPTLDADSANVPIASVSNTGSGDRFRIAVRAGSSGSNEYHIQALTYNFSTVVSAVSTTKADGRYVDIGYRYRTSDDRFELWVDRTLAASGTASATITGAEGTVGLDLSFLSISFLPAQHQNIAIYSEYSTDTEMATYRHEVLTGDERNLLGSWHFTEGTGTSVADTTATSNLTLTGGAWIQMVNPSPRGSTGTLEAIGQWYRRSALRIGTGYSTATSPSLGTAARHVTIGTIVRMDSDHPAGLNSQMGGYGPSAGNSELRFVVNSDFTLSATSLRTSSGTVTTASAINDGVTRRFVATLESDDNSQSTVTLYMAEGSGDFVTVGTATTGAYDAAASCVIIIGTSDNVSVLLSSFRVYGALRTPSQVNLGGPADLSDPDIIESLELDGEVVSDVVPARSYTTANLTYETIGNPNVTRPAPGRDGLGYPRAEEIQDQIRRIPFVFEAEVEVSEVYVEVWDRLNSDGWVEIGSVPLWSTWRPAKNRVYGAARSYRKPMAGRGASGHPFLQSGFSSDGVAVRFEFLENDVTTAAEIDELERRLLRLRGDLLVFVAYDPQVPQWILVDRSVCGVVGEIRAIEDSDDFYAGTEVRFAGVL